MRARTEVTGMRRVKIATTSRDGELVGTYDKVHLAPGEELQMKRGEGFPVHEIDGIKVGMQICFDLNFQPSPQTGPLRGALPLIQPQAGSSMRASQL